MFQTLFSTAKIILSIYVGVLYIFSFTNDLFSFLQNVN